MQGSFSGPLAVILGGEDRTGLIPLLQSNKFYPREYEAFTNRSREFVAHTNPALPFVSMSALDFRELEDLHRNFSVVSVELRTAAIKDHDYQVGRTCTGHLRLI